MGSIAMHRDRGQTDREFFQAGLLGDRSTILDCATVDFTFYAAVATVGEEVEVWALVVDYHWTRDEFNFTYKAMDETQGPYFHRCPPRVLDLLSSTDSAYAQGWRDQCREYAAKHEARPRLRAGLTVTFAAEYLTPTGPARTFECLDARRCRFREVKSGAVYTLKGARRTPFEVATA